MIIYHGSNLKIVTPTYGVGNIHNDYGQGFYCTEHSDLAAEWACSKEHNGFVNKYELDTSALDIFSLMCEEYHILHWLAILLNNRTFSLNSEIKKTGFEYIKENFLPDYVSADVMIGYRADDSYFSFANAFLANEITLSQLNRAMKLGNLGEQIVLKSKKAFESLQFVTADSVLKQEYYPKKLYRDKTARDSFSKLRGDSIQDGIYLIDILRCKRGEVDELIRRELS